MDEELVAKVESAFQEARIEYSPDVIEAVQERVREGPPLELIEGEGEIGLLEVQAVAELIETNVRVVVEVLHRQGIKGVDRRYLEGALRSAGLCPIWPFC